MGGAGAAVGGVSSSGEGAAAASAADGLGDSLAARERGEVARHPRRVRAMVGRGHCPRPAQTFIRWSRLGEWERLLAMAQARGVELGMGWRHASSPRRHLDPRPPEGGRRDQNGAAPAQRGAGQALGRSHGGYGTKACVIADGARRAVAFVLAPRSGARTATGRAAARPLAGRAAVGRGRSRRQQPRPPRPHLDLESRRTARHPAAGQRSPRRLPGADLQQPQPRRAVRGTAPDRAVATRYEKTARSCLGVLCLAATIDWLRR